MTTSLPTTVIRPNQRFETGSIISLFLAIKNQFTHRDMIYQLFRKDFFAGYKKSFIGSTWIVLTPVAGIISWIFLHRAQIIKPGDVGVPYPAYILIGTLVWGFFLRISSAFMGAMQNYRYLILWTSFPHEAIFGTQLLLKTVDFFISFCASVAILLLFKIELSWGIILFPFVIIPLLFFAVAVGLSVSVISVVSYDLRRIVTALFGLVMFLTPVIYSADAVGNTMLQKIIQLNPLTYLVCSARDVILFGRLYNTQGFIISSTLAFLLLFISWRIFFISEDRIIERMI